MTTTPFEDAVAGGNANAPWTTLAEEETFLDALVSSNGGRVAYTVVGTSVQGRDLRCVRVGNPAPATPDGNPTMLVEATMHGHEPAPREAALQFIRDLAETADATILTFLETHTVLVFPTANPDGRQADTRNNANNADCNRDFYALLQPETRAVIGQTVAWSPVVYFSGHEIPDVRANDVEYGRVRNTQAAPSILTSSETLMTDRLAAMYTAEGVSHTVYTEGNRSDKAFSHEAGGMHFAVSVLNETTGSGADASPRDFRVANHLLGMDETFAYFRDNAAALASQQTAAVADKVAEGVATGGTFDLQNGTVVDPAPRGYRLTAAQADTLSDQLALLDAYTYPDDVDTIVTMGQRVGPVVPFTMDGAAVLVDSPAPPVSATRLSDLPRAALIFRGGAAVGTASGVVRGGTFVAS